MVDEMVGNFMTERESTHGFLPITGMRIEVLGTKHNGFNGVVVEKPKGWPDRALAILLDEWDEPIKLFNHNVRIKL